MRHASNLPLPAAPDSRRARGDWQTIRTLLPYLWEYRVRVLFALICLISAKAANVGVPVLLKQIVDALMPGAGAAQLALAVPLGLVLAYGALRLSNTVFTELRELVFAKVTERAVRRVALQVFQHLHALSLRFHLERQTGGLTRDIELGTRAISSLVSYTLYSILPTLVEIGLVLGYLLLSAWVYAPAWERAFRSDASPVAWLSSALLLTLSITALRLLGERAGARRAPESVAT